MNTVRWGSIIATAEGARYSHTLGIQAGTGSFNVARESDTIPRTATVTMIDDYGVTVTLPSCVANDYTPKHNGTDGSFTFSDRRAFWAFLEPSRERYEDTAREVAIAILDGMGESGYSVTSVPETEYKVEYDQPTNPAQMLADLCDETGCAVYYNIQTDKIEILSSTDSAVNLDGYPKKKPDYVITGKGGILPEECKIIGGYDINEITIDSLEPIKLDADGKIEVIADADIQDAVDLIVSSFAGKSGDEEKNLQKSMLKWFRIPALIDTSEFPRDDVLPLLNELNTEVEDKATGKKKPDVPHIIGTVPSKTVPFKNVEGRVDGGYNIDYQSGIVKFNTPQIKKNSTTGKWEVSDLELVMAYADPTFNFESEPVSTNRDKTTIETEYVTLSDLHEKYVDNESVNATDINDYATEYLTNYIVKYAQENAGQATCVGIINAPTPVLNVTVEFVCSQEGWVTKVGLERAVSRYALDFKAYKAQQRNSRSMAVTGNRKVDESQGDNKTRKNAVSVDNKETQEAMPKEIHDAVKCVAGDDIPSGSPMVSTLLNSLGQFVVELATEGDLGVFINATGLAITSGDEFAATPSGKLSLAKVDSVTVGAEYGVDASGLMVEGGKGFKCVGDGGNDEAHLMQTGDVPDSLCFNQTGGVIPANSAVKLNGSFTDGARQVIKPDADSIDPSLIVFSGNTPVPIGKPFRASTQYETKVAINGSPSAGDAIGTANAQWYLNDGNTGFKSRGVTGGLAYASPFSGGVTQLYAFRTDAIALPAIAYTPVTSGDVLSAAWDDFNNPIKVGELLTTGAVTNPTLAFTIGSGTNSTSPSSVVGIYIQSVSGTSYVYPYLELKDSDGNIYSGYAGTASSIEVRTEGGGNLNIPISNQMQIPITATITSWRMSMRYTGGSRSINLTWRIVPSTLWIVCFNPFNID